MCSVLRLLLVWLILDALLLTGVSRRHTRRRPGLPVCSFFLRHSLSPLRLPLKYIKASGNWTSMICMFSLKVVALVDDPCLVTAFAQIITSRTMLEDQFKPWSHQLVWNKVRFITLRFLSFNGILVPGYTLISNSLGLRLVAYKPFGALAERSTKMRTFTLKRCASTVLQPLRIYAYLRQFAAKTKYRIIFYGYRVKTLV